MGRRRIRPLGKVTQDIEKNLVEMVYDHCLQHHEVLGIIHWYLKAHCPQGTEEYLDGTNPDLVVTYVPKQRRRR